MKTMLVAETSIEKAIREAKEEKKALIEKFGSVEKAEEYLEKRREKALKQLGDIGVTLRTVKKLKKTKTD
jgi:hypothetical protein